MENVPDRSGLIKVLRMLGHFLPGNYLKTLFYLNAIAKPRKALRQLLTSFYRMDHIYEVLRECNRAYRGNFSILEFGTAKGYSFTKMLYATKYLHMDNRIAVHAFDSFEGLPAPTSPADRGLIGENWAKGQYKGDYQVLEDYCRHHYNNYRIHKGLFEDTLTDEFLNDIRAHPPVLVWIDCDYYLSAKTVFERLIPNLPNGCVIYFDDYDFNYGSRFTGEARIVYEINHGLFGDEIELVPDHDLSWDSDRIYRFINYKSDIQYERYSEEDWVGRARKRTSDSPMP